MSDIVAKNGFVTTVMPNFYKFHYFFLIFGLFSVILWSPSLKQVEASMGFCPMPIRPKARKEAGGTEKNLTVACYGQMYIAAVKGVDAALYVTRQVEKYMMRTGMWRRSSFASLEKKRCQRS